MQAQPIFAIWQEEYFKIYFDYEILLYINSVENLYTEHTYKKSGIEMNPKVLSD